MDLSHSFTVPAPIHEVWDTFMDLEQVGGCFPGATVSSVDGDSFQGTVKVKLGPIALLYNGSGRFVERDASAHHAKIEAKGKDKRGNGTAGATVSIKLSADGDATRADVVTDLSITGKPAQFGRGVMQDVSDKLLAQFVTCIEQKLSRPAETAPAAAPTAPTPEADAPAVERRVAPTPATPGRHAAGHDRDDALDLGTAAMPVIARQVAPYLGGLAALVFGGWLFRRMRRRRRRWW